MTCIQPGDVVVEDRAKTLPDSEVLVLQNNLSKYTRELNLKDAHLYSKY